MFLAKKSAKRWVQLGNLLRLRVSLEISRAIDRAGMLPASRGEIARTHSFRRHYTMQPENRLSRRELVRRGFQTGPKNQFRDTETSDGNWRGTRASGNAGCNFLADP